MSEPGVYETSRGHVYVAPDEYERWETERRQRTDEERERHERQREYENYRLPDEDRRRLRGQHLAQEVVSRLQSETNLLRWYVGKLETELWEHARHTFMFDDMLLARCVALGLSLAGVQDKREVGDA